MRKLCLFLVLAFFSNAKAQTYAPVTDTLYADSWEQYFEHTFGLLTKAHYPSGYLLDLGSPTEKDLFANGAENDTAFNMIDWYYLQNSVRASYYRPDSLIDYGTIDSLKEDYIAQNDVLPWGFIDMNVHRFRDSAFISGALNVNSAYRIEEVSNDPSQIYVSAKVFCAAPLNMDLYTFTPTFILKPEFIFSNNPSAISSIEIDAGDGQGFRQVEINTNFSADYSEEGYKQFITKVTYDNDQVLFSRSEIYVYDPEYFRAASESNVDYDDIVYIGPSSMGDVAFANTYPTEYDEGFHNPNSVEVGIWWGCGNISQEIRKPFIIFGGYNPKEGKTLAGNTNAPWINDNFGPLLALGGWRGPMYETYNGFFTSESKDPNHVTGANGNEFLNKIRKEGFDILIVQFTPGIKYLQNNAYLCTKVLNYVNNRMKTNPVNNPGPDLDPEDLMYPYSTALRPARHEIVVAGYSAGALSSRLGMLAMEYQHENNRCAPYSTAIKYPRHRVKTWIGFDCENQGSNVPLGFQMFLDFQETLLAFPANNGDILNSIIAKSALKLLKEPGVSTQNTLYVLNKLTYTGGSNWSVGHHSDFDDYFEDLTDVSLYNPANLTGYPKKCYRIGVTQGSAKGHNQVFSGSSIMYNESPSPMCQTPMGSIYGVSNLTLRITMYRRAEAKAITASNNNAFKCKWGISTQLFSQSWYTFIAHHKYHDNNYISDQYLGTAQPYDVTAASMLPSHKLISQKLYFSDANPVVAAFNHCNIINYNPKAHGFSPTPSGLDLHSPGQNTLPRLPNLALIPGNVSGGMNLMKQNNYNLALPGMGNAPDYNDFGYPHLTFPTNHYDYTPLDAIWANGDHDASKYDENTLHVEDPSPHIGEFLVEEIAPHNLYLSNRTIKGDICPLALPNPTMEKYYADFEARNSVLAGNQTIYQHNTPKYPRIRTAQGDFIIDDGGVVTIRANNDNGQSSVVLGAGFSAKHGSILRAYVFNDASMCPPFSYGSRPANTTEPAAQRIKKSRTIIATKAPSVEAAVAKKRNSANIGPYPNPTSGAVIYTPRGMEQLNYILRDVVGKELASGKLNEVGNSIDLSTYKAGVYFITILGEGFKQTDRIILQE